MKVLFVNENLGGHVTTHLHLRRALAGRPGVEARFLDVPPPGLARRLAAAPVPGLARLDLDLQPLRGQLAASAWTRAHLRPQLAWADVAHVFTHNAALLSAAQLATVPSVVALDGTNAMNAYKLPYRLPTRFTPWTVAATRPFETRVYAAAQVLVATSETAAGSLRERYGVDPDRVRVIHYGITAPDFPTAAAPGTGTDRPRLVFVGKELERKGGRQLLRVHQEHLAARCDLVLVTREQVDPAPGVTVVNDLVPGDPRLWELLRAAAALVFPSRIDQQPNAVMEAMAAGLPVVGARVNAIADMIDHEVTGIALSDDTDETLTRAVSRLLDDPAARARLGAAGRARFDDRFSAAGTLDRLLDVLAEARESHRRRASVRGGRRT